MLLSSYNNICIYLLKLLCVLILRQVMVGEWEGPAVVAVLCPRMLPREAASALVCLAGTHFTCITSTKVQILT